MLKKLNSRWLLTFIFVFSQAFTWVGATEQVRLIRPDGSELLSYVDLPDHDYLYPIVFAIDGVPCRSVIPLHDSILPSAEPLGAALITLEKQGITGVNAINQNEYDRTYCREARVADYMQYIQEIRNGLFDRWNGQIIFVGGSEGGTVIGAIAPVIPETAAVVILASGGGVSIREEMHWAIRHYLEGQWMPRFAIDEMMRTVEKQFDLMIQNPTHTKSLGEFTYKWWASHLQSKKLLDNMLLIDCPIFYAHGTEDPVIPFFSAEIAVEEFFKSGKTNLYFRPMPGYEHDIRIPPANIDGEAFEWLSNVIAFGDPRSDDDLIFDDDLLFDDDLTLDDDLLFDDEPSSEKEDDCTSDEKPSDVEPALDDIPLPVGNLHHLMIDVFGKRLTQ